MLQTNFFSSSSVCKLEQVSNFASVMIGVCSQIKLFWSTFLIALSCGSLIFSNWKYLQTSLSSKVHRIQLTSLPVFAHSEIVSFSISALAIAIAYECGTGPMEPGLPPIPLSGQFWEPDSPATSWQLLDPGLLKARPHIAMVGI